MSPAYWRITFGNGRSFFATSCRDESRPSVERLFQQGLQRADGVEQNLGAAIGELRRE